MNHEFALIDWIRQQTRESSAVPIGIGDDCAVLNTSCERQFLIGKDILLEGTHFDLSKTPPELVGRKALAVNLSDIAAMAGNPVAAFVGLALPSSGGRILAEQVMTGIQLLTNEFNVTIAGGDTNIWNGPLVISVTIVGETTGRGPVCRQGAQVGDWIFVTGLLGGSLDSGRHLSFTPKIQLAQNLHSKVQLHAMIDLSDGLSSDLQHILKASNVGAVIEADSIPIHQDVPAHLPNQDRLRHALNDGEDFELLFTVSALDGEVLCQAGDEPRCIKIGEIVTGQDAQLIDPTGQATPLTDGGWEHRFD